MSTPKDYRTAPGMDRCDVCFSRRDDGMGCTKHDFDAGAGYQPNHLCADFAPRSMGQRFEQDPPGPGVEGDPDKLAELSQAITGVEVLRVGTWNNVKVDRAALSAMVNAFGEVGFSPPVKVGHVQEADAPAWGWVENLRVEGDVLLADFRDVPDDLVAQIKDKRYDAVSAELWQDIKRDKKKFPWVLKAVALLGAHPPAVAGLKPPSESLALLAQLESAATVVISAKLPEENPGMTKPGSSPATGDQPGGQETQLAQQNAQLATQVAELQAQLATAQATAETAQKAAGAAGTIAIELQTLQEQVRKLSTENAKVYEDRRQEKIAALAARLKMPSLRPHFAALGDLVTREGAAKEVTFAASGDAAKAVPTDPMEVINDLITRINNRVDVLFSEEVRGGDLREARAEITGQPGDPGMALSAKVNELMTAEKLTYDQARARVWGAPANRELVAAYDRAGS